MSEVSDVPFDVVYLGIGGAAWVVAGLKIRAWRRGPTPGLLVVSLLVACPATAFVVASPLVYRLLDHAAQLGNLATLLVYLGITGFSAAAVALARIWTPPGERADAAVWDAAAPETWRGVRRRLAALGVLVPAMVVLFLVGHPARPETPLTFDTTFAPIAAVAAFLTIYQLIFGYALLDIARVCLGHAAQLPPGWLRRGIRLIAAGSLVACGYVCCKLLAIGAAAFGAGGLDWLSTVLGPGFAAFGAVLVTTGFAAPATAAWARRRGDYRALRPLWELVYQADQRLALEAPGSAWSERLAFRDLEWRTARRGLEIRDGQLTLRPWVDPAVVAAAEEVAARRELDPAERDALVVAAALRAAVEALAAEVPPRPREEQVRLPGLDTDPAEERAHLVRVAQRLHAPLTAAALAIAAPDRPDPQGASA